MVLKTEGFADLLMVWRYHCEISGWEPAEMDRSEFMRVHEIDINFPAAEAPGLLVTHGAPSTG